MFKRALLATTFAVAASASVQVQAQSLITENFDNISTLATSGWVLTNLSSPAGSNSWFQGNSGVFSAQAGAATAYIGANFNSAAVGGTIANWLISPTFSTASAGTVSFYVRSDLSAPYFDSLKFGLGTTASSDTTTFTSLVSVTPLSGVWTQYSMSFAAQGSNSVGRFAIEYFGPADTSNYIGVDTFSVTAAVPEPGTFAMLGLGLGLVGVTLRRKSV